MKKNPLISIVICARSGLNFIDPCFKSVLSQRYQNFEVICVQGGGPKGVINKLQEYARKDKRFKVFTNYDKQPEGIGNKKWFGFKKAKGDIIGIIDLDNVLQKDSVFDEVVSIFSKEKRVTGVLAGLKHDKRDRPLVRFVSLVGGDPFFSYRSIDFLRNARRKVIEKETSWYEKIPMSLNNLYLTGGNVFFYSREAIEKAGGYDQDIMTVQRIVKNGYTNLFVVKNATKHYASESIKKLASKMFKQKDRAFYEKSDEERFNYFPETFKEKKEFFRNLSYSLLIIPNFIYSFRLFFRTGDLVSFVFPLLAFSTTLSHGFNYFQRNFI